MTASLSGLERTLAAELAGEPLMAAALGKLSADSRASATRHRAALARAHASGPDEPRAWAASAYTGIGMDLDRVEAALAALRQQENRALQASLAESARQTQHAMLLLIVTMLAGSSLLIYTFGARENAARERLRVVRALRRNDERFRGLFDTHPVPMYIFDRETLRFIAVNAAAVQQYGYSESEFLEHDDSRDPAERGSRPPRIASVAQRRVAASRAAPWRASGITGARTARRSTPTFRTTR